MGLELVATVLVAFGIVEGETALPELGFGLGNGLDDFVEGHDFVLVGELVDGDELVAVRNVAVKLWRDGEDDGGLGRGVKLAENRTPASGFCRRDGAEPEA